VPKIPDNSPSLTDSALRATVKAQTLARAVRTRVQAVQDEVAERGDRGDGPIPTVIIIMATIAGALLIAGALATLYGKYSAKLGGE
jgi:ABC-type hemin transport system substrate-binding protein